MAERSELRTDAGAIRTIAVEATDPALVSAAVRELGLEALPDTCVARGLKALAGFGGRRWARRRRRHELRQVPRRRAGPPRALAEGGRSGGGHAPRRRPDADGRLDAGAIARTVDAIVAMVRQARRLGVGGDRRGRDGRAAARAERGGADRRRAGALRRGGRDPLRARKRRGSPMSRPRTGSCSAAGRWSCSTPAAAVRSSPSSATDSVDERFSVNVGAVALTERHGLDGVTSRETLDRRPARGRRRSRTASRA